MAHTPPRVTTSSVAGASVWVVELRDDLDLSSVAELDAVLAPLLDGGDPVTVDLTDVTLIESRILGTLITAAKRTSPHGFAVVAPSSIPAAALFELINARAFFAIFPDLNAALSWCQVSRPD